MTVQTNNKPIRKSPFTVSISTELKWETMTTREKPIDNAVLTCSDQMMSMCDDLATVGILGSVQALQLYFKNDKRRLNKAVDYKFLKKHTITRGNNAIPLYSLGATGLFIVFGPEYESYANYWKKFDKNDVLRRLVFNQLLSSMRKENNKIEVLNSEKPFTGAIDRNGKQYHILVVRGNENEINQFFRYEQDKIPNRMLIIVEEMNHLTPIKETIKPFHEAIRITTDLDFTEPVERMFYQFIDNDWQKEYLSV